MLLAGLAIGLGMLTKGPVALVLPALVYLSARLVLADGLLPTRRGWFGLRWIDVALATLVLLAVALPWFLAMADVHGIAYLRRFFIGENLERFATERYNGRRPLWFYAPIIFGGLAPWSSLMVLWIPPLGRVLRGVRRLTELEWRLILWALVPVFFYTLSVGQQPRYILPVLPPLAVLVARTLVSRLRSERGRGPARSGRRHGDHRQRARVPRARLPAVPGAAAALRAVAAAGPDRHGDHRGRRAGAARLDVVRPPTPAAGGRRDLGGGARSSRCSSPSTPAAAPNRCS